MADEYVKRQPLEAAIAELMPSLLSPDGSHPADEAIYAAQEMCVDAMQVVHEFPKADVAKLDIAQRIVYEVANVDGEPPIAWKCGNCGEVMDTMWNFARFVGQNYTEERVEGAAKGHDN